MNTVDEKEILEIEKLKQDLHNQNQHLLLEMRRTNYDGLKLILYTLAVSAGAMFAIVQTIILLQKVVIMLDKYLNVWIALAMFLGFLMGLPFLIEEIMILNA